MKPNDDQTETPATHTHDHESTDHDAEGDCGDHDYGAEGDCGDHDHGHEEDCGDHDHGAEGDCSGDCEDCPGERYPGLLGGPEGLLGQGARSAERAVLGDRGTVDRRRYAQLLATVGGLTALGSLAAPIAGLTRVFQRKYTGPIYSDGVELVDADGNPVGLDALEYGEQMTVFPSTHPDVEDAPTLLVRYPEAEYGDAVKGGFLVEGYAAYSKVCTHAGCMVSDTDGDLLVCPCHIGKYDPKTGASVAGGPPSRGLPQLPITLSSDGALIATRDFEGHVGPGGG